MKLLLQKNKNIINSSGVGIKKQIKITGSLANILRPGKSALYLYQGDLIRTSAVNAIIEASADHISFETEDSVYTITYLNPSDSHQIVKVIA